MKHKSTPRNEQDIKNLKLRLNKISGQINGVVKMIDDNRYCKDILIQISAIESALKEVGYLVLKEHLLTCVSDDVKNNDNTSLIESFDLAKKLWK